MTAQRKLVSAFIVWHLVATATAALPSGTWVDRPPGESNGVVRAFDGVGRTISRVVGLGRRVSSSATGSAVNPYLTLTSQGQQWGMFSTPWEFDRYWRARYYVRGTDGTTWRATELIGPGQFDGRVRLLQSFRDSFRDKALEVTTDAFKRRRALAAIRPGTRPDELPDDLVPIARYFARRFATRLGPSERIVRTDVWVGNANNAPPGGAPARASRAVRAAVLRVYAGGPVEDRLRAPSYPPYHGVEVEADISWVLEYFEEP